MTDTTAPTTSGRDFSLGPPYVETEALRLDLIVDDPEVAAVLRAQKAGRQRHAYALTALRIGVAALHNAQDRHDADKVRHESTRLMEHLQRELARHSDDVLARMTGRLKEYFDPDSGRFDERVGRLVGRDGELEQVLRRQFASEDSELARTLANFVGENSELRRLLGAESPDGLPQKLQQMTSTLLCEHRERILGEFSLDSQDSALSRLVRELRERHGEMSRDIRGSVERVVGEFSLDREDSALSRLVGRVERAQRRISEEFSLDAQGSALARLKGELELVLRQHREDSERFRTEVLKALAQMNARRDEAMRSTRHGGDFEQALCTSLRDQIASSGDIVDHVGAETGVMRHCKKGDILITLGSERRARGARIVVEAKQSGRYSVSQALAEIDQARKNRDAQVGIFVFSRRTAPDGVEPLTRHGNDIVVTWDADDAGSDIYVECAVSIARALCTRAAVSQASRQVDPEAFSRAVREIEKQLGRLEDIQTWAVTICSNGEKIRSRAATVARKMLREVESLDARTVELRHALAQRDTA